MHQTGHQIRDRAAKSRNSNCHAQQNCEGPDTAAWRIPGCAGSVLVIFSLGIFCSFKAVVVTTCRFLLRTLLKYVYVFYKFGASKCSIHSILKKNP